MPSRNDQDKAISARKTGRARWELSSIDHREDDPSAMLICDGLLGICCTKAGNCEIGFLSAPESDDEDLAKHKPEITVIAVASGEVEVLFRLQWQRKAPTFSRLRLKLKKGRRTARFLLNGCTDDFSKIVDLETRFNLGNPMRIQRSAFSPCLEIMNGDFFTLLLTPQTYTACPIDHNAEKQKLGQLPFLIAADLHCDRKNGAVSLEIDGGIFKGWVKLGEWPVIDKKIFVVVHNNCQEADGRKCIDAMPDRDTDFHCYYEAMPDEPKYNIRCDTDPKLPDFCTLPEDLRRALETAGLIEPKDSKRSTNPTPCGGGGFGGSSSLEGG